MSANPANVLAVIPTLNEADTIEVVLDRLVAGSPEMEQVKVVVADGGSSDGTVQIVARYGRQHPNVSLVHNPARLQSAGINRAVALAAEPHHRVLVRCDAHAVYPDRYILDVADSLVARDVDGLATVMDSGGPGCFRRGSAWAVDSKLGSGGSGHRGGAASGYVDHGHHAGFDLDTFRAVGGYADDFATNEDAELDHRIGESGGRIWLDADIRVGYIMRPTLRSLAKQYWRYGRGRARTVRRHRLLPRMRQMVPPAALAANALALLLAVIHPAFLLIPALYLIVLAVVSVQLFLRHRSLCAFWAGPALAAMHLAWGAGFLWQIPQEEDSA